MKFEQSVFIDIADILTVGEQSPISSLDELVDHIKQRETLFLSQAAHYCRTDQLHIVALPHILSMILSEGKNPFEDDVWFSGWETISVEDETVLKQNTSPLSIEYKAKINSIFTGKHFCGKLSSTLAIAIQEIIETNQLPCMVELIALITSYDAENWDKNLPTQTDVIHVVTRLTDESGAHQIYLDPTYAQIDHRYAGQILVVESRELDTYYQQSVKTRHGSQRIPASLLQSDAADPEKQIKQLSRLL